MISKYPRHADDLSLCLDHSICDRVHIGRPEDYPVPARRFSPDEPAVTVLNGIVRAGDRIAYAVSNSSSVTMNIGEVLSLDERDVYGRKVPVLKVRVDKSSSSWPRVNRTVTLDCLDRVVKL